MRNLCVLALVLLVAVLLGAGCVTDADKKQWAEAMRDLRGENMEMGSHDRASP